MISKKRKMFLILFIIYILLTLNFTIFRFGFYHDVRKLNLSLFTDLINMYRVSGRKMFLWLVLGNIFGFSPFGFLLAILQKKPSFAKVVLLGFTFSLFIETTQYITRKGVAELDDLILNTLGVAIGYWVYKLFCRLFRGSADY